MIVKPYVLAIVGVPEMTPVAGARERPAGNEPTDTDQANRDVPPVMAMVWLYGTPTSPGGNDKVVITGAALIVIVNGLIPVAAILSVTMIVKLKTPMVVGVPEITPVVGAMVSPAGSAPTETDHA
jgi:hypothetical protein